MLKFNLFLTDVAVGSYSSGHVMVIRSRPVAILEGSTSTIPTKLAYSAKNFEIKACVKYSGRGVPETERESRLIY